MATEQTIKEAQMELMALQRAISKELTNYEQKYGVRFAYTAFVDHAPEGTADIRLIANL